MLISVHELWVDDSYAIVMKLVGVEIEKVEEWDNALFFLREIPNSGE